jgi:phospholipase/lecithinase/hemolysin
VQGTAGHQNFSFIGDYLNLAYTPDTLLSDQIVQNFTGTAEGGPNWVEYLTGCGLQPGLTSPLTCKRKLWDFAFAGADVSEQLYVLFPYSLENCRLLANIACSTPVHHNYTTPLVNQTAQFLTYGDAVLKDKAGVKPLNTLIAIWIGINDINDSAKYALSSFNDFYTSIIETLFTASVEPLQKAGYRNFLFLNLPPLDRTPSNLLRDPAVRLPNVTMLGWWNDALQKRAEEFATEASGVKAMVWDANKFLNGVLDHPEEYGIRNTTNFCPGYLYADVLTDPGKYGCPVPLDEYFWFNSGHM